MIYDLDLSARRRGEGFVLFASGRFSNGGISIQLLKADPGEQNFDFELRESQTGLGIMMLVPFSETFDCREAFERDLVRVRYSSMTFFIGLKPEESE